MLTNTISQTFQKTKTGLSIAPRNKKQCLLIVFGALERMSALCDVLQSAEVDITCCHSIAEVGVIAAHKYDLVIVDVSSTEIVKVLRIVRNREIEASIPVLVESGRLRGESDLAGVLPLFRAMPCSFPELLKLAHQLLSRGVPYHSDRYGNSHIL